MKKLFSTVFIFLSITIFSLELEASITINSVTLDGSTAVSVASAGSISANINVSTDEDKRKNDWLSTRWTIGTETGCIIHSNDEAGNYSETIQVVAPILPGIYNAIFIAYRKGDCSNPAGDTLTLTNGVTVVSPKADYHFDECYASSGFKEESGDYNATAVSSVVTDIGKLNNAISISSGTGSDIDSAIDTRVDINNNIGNKGSISFWYKSNTDWNGGGIRTLFDASSNSKYFYLTLGNDGKLYFGLEDSNDNDFRYSTNTFNHITGTWVHITATWDLINNKMKLFVDTVESLNENINSNNILGDLNTLYIGDNRTTYIAAHHPTNGYNGQSANGSFDELKIYNIPLNVSSISNIYKKENAGQNYDGDNRGVSNCNVSNLCNLIKTEYSTTSNGYFYVNESIAGSVGLKPFEIYCSEMSTTEPNLNLPTVINQSETSSENSNFRFTNKVDTKYYSSSSTKEYFTTLPIDNSFEAESTFASAGFSNINLIGTPFKVDFSTLALSGCDSASDFTKLRVGNYEQAVKVDPKKDNTNKCSVTKLAFDQISSYYSKDEYIDGGFDSCSDIAKYEYTLTGSVPSDGYYLMKRTNSSRLLVSYCKMTTPSTDQVWTILLGLDGHTTTQKKDITDRDDTCSKIGMDFYVPNNKTTFNTMRDYLKSDKTNLWEDYAGTIREYFIDNGISGWASNGTSTDIRPYPIPDGSMWPYGPMGIYRASDGSGGNNAKNMAMSTEYLSTIDIDDGFSSLDKTGWKSILPEINSDYDDKWWVADIAAGWTRDASTGHLKVISGVPNEPNGDYNANNWLGWFADDNGDIIHYNDQNGVNRYRYSNYMCMGKDFYEKVEFKNNTKIDAYDTFRDGLTDRKISTKIVAKSFDLNISVYTDANKVAYETEPEGIAQVRIINSDELDPCPNIPTYFTAWEDINVTTTSYTSFIVGQGLKEARVQINFNNEQTCSSDSFAIRPSTFSIAPASTSYAGETFSIDFKALDHINNLTSNYNETKDGSFKITSEIGKSSPCVNGILNIAAFSFLNGIKIVDANYSENGDVNITIEEKIGYEFAKVDADDTSETDRLIAPVTQTIVIAPYELNITVADFVSSNGQDWIYDANVSDMNVTASATVQANNKQHQALQNFTSTCYASDVDLGFNYTVLNSNSNVNLSYNPTLLGVSETIANINKTITIPSTDFTSPSASTQYSFNVDRFYNTPLNPIDIELDDVQVTSTTVAKDENGLVVDKNKRFYYGRVSTKDITTNQQSVNHNAKIEVYSNANLSGFKQNSINWYQMKDDSFSTTESISIKADFGMAVDKPGVSITTPNTSNGVINFAITNTWLNSDSAYIHLDVPEFLWYNRYSDYNASQDCATHPCFRYIYNTSNSLNNINSGSFEGSSIVKDRNYTGTYEKAGVKTFR